MIRDKLFGKHDVYKEFKFNPANIDMRGWASDHPILPWPIETIRPKLIIEVGVWKGRSAINIAKNETLGMNFEILCIDTWLDSPERWYQDQWRDSLKLNDGRPDLYGTFLNNLVSNNCQKYITPFTITSEAAFYILEKLGITSELIYIDGDHEYQSVSRDIEMHWSILSESRLMILDDYIRYPGVTIAVNEFSQKLYLKELPIYLVVSCLECKKFQK